MLKKVGLEQNKNVLPSHDIQVKQDLENWVIRIGLVCKYVQHVFLITVSLLYSHNLTVFRTDVQLHVYLYHNADFLGVLVRSGSLKST